MVLNKDIMDSGNTTIWNNAVNPLFGVNDEAATALGTLKDSTVVLFARKSFPDHTSWFMSLPSGDPDLWRFVFQNTEAHIYDTSGDVIYSGGGILTIHTATGGERKIVLKNGKVVQMKIVPNSTILLDTATGEPLLESH